MAGTKTVEMSGNGRLVVPAEVRRSLGLRGPAKFDVRVEDGRIVLIPVITVPVDVNFPITVELAASALRAHKEAGPGLTRDEVVAALGGSRE
jgi:AbrB family looped-hinge helix DNA binding protein